MIRSGKVKIKVTSVFDLGMNLVNARIRSGKDRADLAKRVGVSKSLIVRSEANCYATTAVDVIRKVAQELDVGIPEEVVPSTFNEK